MEAWNGDRKIDLGPRKQRLVFAVLALEAGKPVEVARLVDLAWPDNPPPTAPHAIQVCAQGVTGLTITCISAIFGCSNTAARSGLAD